MKQFALAWILFPASITHAEPQIVHLGILPGASDASATAISASGTTVVGSLSTPNGDRAFRWTSLTKMQDLGLPLGGLDARAHAVNADGTVVVGDVRVVHASFGTRRHAFRWSSTTGFKDLGVLGPDDQAWAYGVSADGSVISGTYDYQRESIHPFIWNAAKGLQTLSFGLTGLQISGDGLWITGTNSFNHMYRWSAATGLEDLGTSLGGNVSVGTSISSDGGVVAGFCVWPGLSTRACRWTKQHGLQNLGAIGVGPSITSTAMGMSGNGLAVVGRASEFTNRAMLWTNELGMVDLNEYLKQLGVVLKDWNLAEATGASFDASAICGNGTLIFEDGSAWIVTGLPPVTCKPDCDLDQSLTINDFVCFQTFFAIGDLAADCDADGLLTIDDFVCFQTVFAVGC